MALRVRSILPCPEQYLGSAAKLISCLLLHGQRSPRMAAGTWEMLGGMAACCVLMSACEQHWGSKVSPQHGGEGVWLEREPASGS